MYSPNHAHPVKTTPTLGQGLKGSCCLFSPEFIINQTLLQTFSSLNWHLLNCMKKVTLQRFTESVSPGWVTSSKHCSSFQARTERKSENYCCLHCGVCVGPDIWPLWRLTFWSEFLERLERLSNSSWPIGASEKASPANMLIAQRVRPSNLHTHSHTHIVVTSGIYSHNVTFHTTNSAPSNTMQTHKHT